jgi:nucleoid-associated protein EbfC
MKGPSMKDLMRQAQQVQETMNRAQAALEQVEVTGAAGGGMVEVTMSAKMQVRRVRIDPALVGDDRDLLEDLVAAAVNDAVRRAEEAAREHMSGVLGGLGLPSGLVPGL